ncbi:MAG TPA: M1 family aminopeptidase [Nitrospira sp.]|nr:M1 family aminopeptidase [Nitrospira sp.]
MRNTFWWPASAWALWLVCLVSPLPDSARASDSSASILHHDLFVEIDPPRHALVASDRVTIEPGGAQGLQFSLAPTLHLDRLVSFPSEASADDAGHDVPFEIDRQASPGAAQRITIPAAALSKGQATLTAYYHGIINDPPKEPRHLRFVTPSETAGHIGSEGVYLSSETQWYVDVPESLSEYRVRVALPSGWTAVTQGKLRSSRSCPAELCSQPDAILMEWEPILPTEALTVVANRFMVKTRDWSSKSGQQVQLGAYLFPEDALLADEYLDATARYLETYSALLGPYPFDVFSVVENFFASGLGMPSFTLLGSGVIKRHYVQPYALGHEIVHSWIGNAVFNRIDRGNWVEGLTTYLANYYWHEWSGDLGQARDQRRLMLRGYNLHVPPERDYPLRQFMQKHDERDNGIGYQKAAMIFHLLRQEVGDEPFWRSLKQLVVRYRGRRADWHDLERVFSDISGKDLRWFFAEWVERSGAPNVSVKTVTARPASSGTFTLQGSVVQTAPLFQSPLPVRIRLSGGAEQTLNLRVKEAELPFTSLLSARPRVIEIDPDATVMRRISREDLPPVLNHYVTDQHRSVVAAFGESLDAAHPFGDIVKRIESQDSQKPEAERTAVIPFVQGLLLPAQGSVLVLASPAMREALQPAIHMHCGRRVELREGGLSIDGTAYDGPAIAALVSCHREDHPGSVVTWLYAVSPQAATTVARLLFFYGWSSFVVFQEGKAIARGEWEPPQTRMEVTIDEPVSHR